MVLGGALVLLGLEVPEWLVTTATVLFAIGAVLMILLIMVQEGKGGDLAAFGGTRAEGVIGVSNPLRRLTAVLAVIVFVLAALVAWAHRPTSGGIEFDKKGEGGSLSPTTKPAATAPAASVTSIAPHKDAESPEGKAAPPPPAKSGAAQPAPGAKTTVPSSAPPKSSPAPKAPEPAPPAKPPAGSQDAPQAPAKATGNRPE